MTQSLPPIEFLNAPGPILDVRAPVEFQKGHIPGSLSFPLFSDLERHQIGTLYHQEGVQQARSLGLQLVMPKIKEITQQALEYAPDKIANIYCARGGERSSSFALLLSMHGFSITLLNQGYKSFRNWALSVLQQEKRLTVVTGYSGAGKTTFLQQLHSEGKQVLDLEALFCHRGSVFGEMKELEQPPYQQIENNLAIQWNQFTSDQPVWIEDESRMIGKRKIPDPIYKQMKQAERFFLDTPKEVRKKKLMKDYSGLPLSQILEGLEKIKKRLTTEKAQELAQFIHNKQKEEILNLLVDYYDQCYKYSVCKSSIPQKSNVKDC